MKQRGAALLLLLMAVSVGLALAMTGSWGQPRSRYQSRHASQTGQALAQARLALIARSLSPNSTIYNHGRPGELPCPDLHPPGDEYEGWAGSTSHASCLDSPDADCNSKCDLQERRIGRLPWKTLGLPRLSDGSGETLWYMVAAPFHDSDTDPLNAGTSLPVALQAFAHGGAAAYPPAVALVFAPGSMLGLQSRSDALQQLSAAGYLERHGSFDNASPLPSALRLNGPLGAADGTLLLNDQLIAVTVADLLPKVFSRVLVEYPATLRKKYPTPPWPLAQEGTCTGTPPNVEIEGEDSDWLNRNEWEKFLVYDCTLMTVTAKPDAI